MKNKKTKLFHSILALLLCVAMLAGTTYAWFTDSVTSGINTIAAGNLDVELYHSNAAVANQKVQADTKLFLDLQGDPILWEPGVVSYENLRVVNEGSLALVYRLAINTANENYILDPANGEMYGLSQILKVGFVEGGITATDRAGVVASVDIANWTTMSDFLRNGSLLPEGKGASEQTWGIVIWWEPGDNDNLWNLNNGKTLNEGDALKIDLGISLVATQELYENDSFGNDYDTNAKDSLFPDFTGSTVTTPVTPNAENKTDAEVSMAAGKVAATVPAGAQLTAGTTALTLTVTELEATGSNIVLGENEAIRSLDVHIEGIAPENTAPITVTLEEIAPVGLNMGNYKLYHVENGATNEMTLLASADAFTAHNQFKYDPATGTIVLYMATFSEVALTANEVNAWNGNIAEGFAGGNGTQENPWVIANADQLAYFGAAVGGMNNNEASTFKGEYVKLIADINLGDDEANNRSGIIFYPIGYNSSDGSYEKTGVAITSTLNNFSGTFDGQGHTIANFYHNTWEMKGDNEYYAATEQRYRDGMGLFGRLYGATIKNLTVKNFSSDGEYTTTGCIAAYADGATFENISITNCNPRVYNIGNGGIVGCVGWYAKEAGMKTTFTNVTVDNSNKISALWGSYDVACGGVVGQYYPTSGQSSAGKPANGGLHLENCHVGAQMDVYNDVCGNYQYYAYRYAGILIGSVRENVTVDGHTYPKMDGITANSCTVHFGTWNDYYYCEFEKNGHPSYSGPDDYKFSRVPHSELNFTDSNGNGIIDTENERASVTGCKHTHTAAENNQAIYLPFNNLVTGYGWGVTTKAVGDLEGVTILDREAANSVVKFQGKVSELMANTEYKFGDLFAFVSKDVELLPAALTVAISNLNENNPVSAVIVYDRENWENGTITFSGTGAINLTIQDYYFCTPTTIKVEIKDRQPVEKFKVVMNNGDFLHRVGNTVDVALEKLFAAADANTKIGNVAVTVTAVNGTAASGTYTANATWTKGTINFDGTGIVKVTITDNDYCTPTELLLEVVDATNVTGATDATSGNIVLLNDATASSLNISNGYTFYGNGFAVKFNGDGSYRSASLAYGFVTISSGGTLDNTQVICKIFPKSYMFTNEMTAGSDGRYPYGYSAIVISDNSTISNCYVYGARNNIQIGAGNVMIQNTVVECGSLSNIHIKSASGNSVTLDNVTTIQQKVKDEFGVGNMMLGFGILVGDNESETYPTIKITGDLKQYNWASKADADDVSSTYAKQAINNAVSKDNYVHTLDGVKKINLGMVFLTTNSPNIQDNRSETVKSQVPYVLDTVTISGYSGQVYSVQKGSQVTESSRYDATVDGVIPYAPKAQNVIVPQVSHSGANGSSLTINTAFDKNWITTFTADLDNITGGSYSFKFSDFIIKKYGKELSYTVKDASGNAVSKDTVVTLNQLHTSEYTLVVTDNAIYNENGELSGKTVTHEMPFVLYATKTSIEPPKFDGIGSGVNGAIRLVSSSGGNWRPAYPALQGVTVKYWSASEGKTKEIDLATLTNSGTISGQKWTYTCNDFTLTITGGPVHTTTSYVLSPMIATRDGEKILYFAAANKDNSTGTTARLICLEYVFTDKNASTTVGQCTSYSNGIATVQYANLPEFSWSSFQKGTVEEITSSTPCITPDTLITLADGRQVRVDSLTGDEQLLVWNLKTGKYDSAPIVFVDSDAEQEYEIIHLYFSDGSDVKVIYEHGFFDLDLGKYVYIDATNYADYVGHRFVAEGNITANKWNTVTLDKVVIEKEVTTAWSPVTFEHLCYYTNGVLSMPGGIAGLFNIFEVDTATMRYNPKKMIKDIETYGLLTLEDFGGMITQEAFDAFNGAYLNVAIGKGLLTWEDIAYMAERYIPLM